MSNILKKEFATIITTTPGAIVRRWHPGGTVLVETVFGIFDGVTVYHQVNGLDFVSETGVFFHVAPDGSIHPVTVTGYFSTSTDVPGYFSYDTEPDTYTVSYSPNLGWNSGARSIPNVSGDGTALFSVPVDVVGVCVGLANNTIPFTTHYTHIAAGLVFSSGFLRIYESGVLTPAGTYVGEDIFSFTRYGEDVYALKNGLVSYKFTAPNTDNLALEAFLYSGGDSVIDSSLVDGTSIVQRSAALTNTSAVISATPKPAAILTNNTSALVSNGYWFDGTDLHAGPQALVATSSFVVVKEFGDAALTAISTLAGTGHHVQEIHGVFGAMTASLTSGYYMYAEIRASLPAMTADASAIGELAPTIDYIAASFPQMEANINSLVGEVGTISASFQSMDALLANKAYAEINVSFQPMRALAVEYPPVGSFAILSAPAFSLLARGYATDSNFADLNLFGITGTALGGATSANSLFDLSLSSTGTMLDTGSAVLLPMFTCTLSATGRREERGEATLLPFISSTLTAFGGGAAALTGPTFTFASTGTGNPTGKAELPFLSFTLSSTGTRNETGTAALLPMFTMALSYSTCSGAAPLFTLSSAGSDAVNNAVAYVMNVHTQESTKYSNFGFMHIINIGNKPYGVKADGLYLLEGTTDNGVAINGSATTKETDFGSFQSKNVPTAYLNSDTLTTITPIVDAVTHPAYSSTFGGRKTLIARGITGRYWKFKIDGIQQVEGVEFLPETRQRRVK